jgi:hypothetical protein
MSSLASHNFIGGSAKHSWRVGQKFLAVGQKILGMYYILSITFLPTDSYQSITINPSPSAHYFIFILPPPLNAKIADHNAVCIFVFLTLDNTLLFYGEGSS